LNGLHAGRRYLITGATSGIGLATSVVLARQGANLVLTARRAGELERLVEDLPGDHLAMPFDLTATDEIPQMVGRASREVNGLHGLVHCAGIHRVTPLKMVNTRSVEDVFSLNVIAAMMLAKGFRVRHVHAPAASIVFLSSAVGAVGQKGVSAYSASKGAVISLTKSLALELAGEDIRVNCVLPGVVRTPMTEALHESIGEDAFAEVEAMHPLGLGQPDDVAEPISFLLGVRSRWMTGAALAVDGGYTAQ